MIASDLGEGIGRTDFVVPEPHIQQQTLACHIVDMAAVVVVELANMLIEVSHMVLAEGHFQCRSFLHHHCWEHSHQVMDIW